MESHSLAPIGCTQAVLVLAARQGTGAAIAITAITAAAAIAQNTRRRLL
jgi:hypothetical protein